MLLRTSREETKVRDAAYLLDAEKPGWAFLVDINTLNMGCIHKCVLGQVYGARTWFGRLIQIRSGYGRGRERLRISQRPEIYSPVFASDSFREHWVKAIRARVEWDEEKVG